MQERLRLELLGAFWFLWASLWDLPVPFKTLERLGRALCPPCVLWPQELWGFAAVLVFLLSFPVPGAAMPHPF